MGNRCYLRGWTALGLFNTIIGCFLGRVLVRIKNLDTGRIIAWRWDRADQHPPEGAS
jgi:hypothetical protein